VVGKSSEIDVFGEKNAGISIINGLNGHVNKGKNEKYR
jgi:hypothetical protein